jgi:hypothetical protein
MEDPRERICVLGSFAGFAKVFADGQAHVCVNARHTHCYASAATECLLLHAIKMYRD